MIQGTVNVDLKAVVRIRIRGPGGPILDVDVIIDTGFTSSLTLPTSTVAALGLTNPESDGEAVLADGSICQFAIYAAEVAWGGGWRPVAVYAVGDEPLLGMRLMAGHRLLVDVLPGGRTEIVPIP